MERGLYASATGMAATQQWLDLVSHNLANVSTTGFKRDAAVFNDTLQRAMYNGEGQYIGELGAGGTMQGRYTVMEVGTLEATGNALDVAIATKEGFFAVQTPNGVRYTRDGSFTLNSDREITTKDGHPVLDSAGREITLPQGAIAIDDQGGVSVDGVLVGEIGVYTGSVMKEGEGLYAGSNMTTVDEPMVQGGALESSNVNAIEEMIAMIELQRIFEMAQRGALSQDEMTQKLLATLQNR